MSEKKVVLVTGANRGIGLEFVNQFAGRGDIVIGTYRTAENSTELLSMAENSDNVFAVIADATDNEALNDIANMISEKFGRLDMLICNAGVNIQYTGAIEEVRANDLTENFRVNVAGPFVCASVFINLLTKSRDAIIVNISSQMGSISRSGGNAIPYRISKAALNMLTKTQSLNYGVKGIITIALHPGWVQTDMGGKEATLTQTESVTSMLKVIDGLTEDQNGGFLSYTGEVIEY